MEQIAAEKLNFFNDVGVFNTVERLGASLLVPAQSSCSGVYFLERLFLPLQSGSNCCSIINLSIAFEGTVFINHTRETNKNACMFSKIKSESERHKV